VNKSTDPSIWNIVETLRLDTVQSMR